MLNKGNKKHICLLGSFEKPMNDNIADTVIVIPNHILTKFHLKRSRTKSGKWSILGNILRSRKKLLQNSYKNNMPIFSSIRETLNFIIEVYKTGKNSLYNLD